MHIGAALAALLMLLGLLFQGMPTTFATADPCLIAVDANTDRTVTKETLRICETHLEKAAALQKQQIKERTPIQRNIQSVDFSIRLLLLAIDPNIRTITITSGKKTSEEILQRIQKNIAMLKEAALAQGEQNKQQQSALQQTIHHLERIQKIASDHIDRETETQKKINAYENAITALRERLFGVKTANAISFEQALAYTEHAARASGIRPEFLLGLIKNETALGHNIGTGTYTTAMHPTRDQTVFPYITETLQYNPDTMPVSANPGFGWGGAMGTAQFIPSTWVCYGGFVNTHTNTCEPVDLVIQSPKTLRVGSTGPDVLRLQQFLNKNGFTIADTGPGSPGNETDRYTHIVAQAVIKFQEHYADRTLKQYGRTRGTGTVNPATRNAINQIDFYAGPWQYDAKRDLIRHFTKNNRPSNPWNPRDAYFASALYLRNLGAATDECKAARRYYAGSNWESRIALNYCRAVISNARAYEKENDS